MFRWWFVVVVAVFSCGDVRSLNRDRSCPNLNAQRAFDLDQLMGQWYAVEVIHHQDTAPESAGAASTPRPMESCPTLRLTRVAVDRVMMGWEEKTARSEFSFLIPVKNSPGQWQVMGEPNGSLSEARNDIHFTETLQVIKGVGPQVVFTFCSRREHQLTTLLLARERKVDEVESVGAKNMLKRRGLKIIRTQETCRKNEATLLHSRSTSLFMFVLVLFGVMASRKNELS